MRALTIEKVHRIFVRVLGDEAVEVQNYVHRVEEREGVVGAVMAADGVLYYDPVWWAEHIDTPEKAQHAVAFECLRKVLDADKRGDDWVQRVATAMVINAFLYDKFDFSELPRAMYSASELPECLMRPLSRGFHSRLHQVYHGVWDRKPRFTSIANVANALRVLFFESSSDGLGMEGDGEDTDTLSQDRPVFENPHHGNTDTTGETPKDLTRLPRDCMPPDLMDQIQAGFCKTAGFGDVETDYVIQRIRQKKSLREKLAEDFSMDRIKRKAKKTFDERIEVESVVPLRLSRRDLYLLANGMQPLMYRNEEEVIDGQGGMAMYIDVSGSFQGFIPYAFGLIDELKDCVDEMYQFSNHVQVTSRQDMIKKNVRVMTTGGTDFDCVVRHAVDHRYSRIAIITDGWADVQNPELKKLAEANIEKVLTILISKIPGQGRTKAGNNGDVEKFLTGTWMGRTYGNCFDLSEAFE